MRGFNEAQAYYDKMFPPEDECPVCGGEDFDAETGDCPHDFYDHDSYWDEEYDDVD